MFFGKCLYKHCLSFHLLPLLSSPLLSSPFLSSPLLTRYYWYVNTLDANGSINDFSGFNWRIYLCLFAGWVIVYLCMFRGIQSTGKVCEFETNLIYKRSILLLIHDNHSFFQVVYITAVFPYIVLVILFFRAVTLDGAGDGIKFLFVPDVSLIFHSLPHSILIFSHYF